MGGSVSKIVKQVTAPVMDLAQSTGIVAAPQQQQAAAPTQTASGDATGTASVSVQQGVAQAAAGAQGGETEVNVGTGRLNRNVAKARQNFRAPPSNTGTPGSSIRI